MNTLMKLALLAAVALLAASCAVAQRETEPVPVTKAASLVPAVEPEESAAVPGWWTRFGDPVLDETVARALRSRKAGNSKADGHALSVRVVRVYVAAAESRVQVDIARRLVRTGSRTLSEMRERYSLGRCSSHDVDAASRDLTWANNLFRQRREDLGHALRRLEFLLDERPGTDFVHALRLPDLPEDGRADPPGETEQRSVERRCDEALGRAVEVRREIEETLTGNRSRSLAFLRAHRDELEAQSRWVAARKRLLDHRIEGLQARAVPEDETARAPGTRTGKASPLSAPSLLTVGRPGFPRGK